MAGDDEEARRKRAEELRQAIEESAPRRPASPREFTDQKAREAAEEKRADEDA
jgi:hypothetical protein